MEQEKANGRGYNYKSVNGTFQLGFSSVISGSAVSDGIIFVQLGLKGQSFEEISHQKIRRGTGRCSGKLR